MKLSTVQWSISEKIHPHASGEREHATQIPTRVHIWWFGMASWGWGDWERRLHWLHWGMFGSDSTYCWSGTHQSLRNAPHPPTRHCCSWPLCRCCCCCCCCWGKCCGWRCSRTCSAGRFGRVGWTRPLLPVRSASAGRRWPQSFCVGAGRWCAVWVGISCRHDGRPQHQTHPTQPPISHDLLSGPSMIFLHWSLWFVTGLKWVRGSLLHFVESCPLQPTDHSPLLADQCLHQSQPKSLTLPWTVSGFVGKWRCWHHLWPPLDSSHFLWVGMRWLDFPQSRDDDVGRIVGFGCKHRANVLLGWWWG